MYSQEGKYLRLVVSNEEKTVAWQAVRAMERFDLAMKLALLVSSGIPDDAAMFQMRDAVLDVQADHDTSQENWVVASCFMHGLISLLKDCYWILHRLTRQLLMN